MSSNTDSKYRSSKAEEAKDFLLASSERQIGLWLLVYLGIATMIYMTYVIGATTLDYKQKRTRETYYFVAISASLFLLSAIFLVAGSPTFAAFTLFISLALDYTTAILVGSNKLVMPNGERAKDAVKGKTASEIDEMIKQGTVMEVKSRGMTYVTISPMIYKTILLGVVTYVGGYKSGSGQCGILLKDLF